MQGERTSRCQVLVDFDGTIAPDDPTDRLLERFANPLWRVVEEAWQDGRITSRECMRRQVRMLRVSREALNQELRNIRIDAGFYAFLQFCRSYSAEVKIVSDGLDRVVDAALMSAGLSVPFFANKLEWRGGNRWRLGFPFARSDCRVAAANCKCSHADKLRQSSHRAGRRWQVGFLHGNARRLRDRQGSTRGLLPASGTIAHDVHRLL